jgi:hypothetical protein
MAKRGGCGARDSRGSHWKTQFLHLNTKIDFIKKKQCNILSLGPSGQQMRARLLNVSTLITFRGEYIKPFAMLNMFCCAFSSNNSMLFFKTLIATVNWKLQLD